MIVLCMFQLFNVAVLCTYSFSHTSHSVPSEAAEAGEDQRLFTDGGGVHQEPGANETLRRKTGGRPPFSSTSHPSVLHFR